LDLPPFDRGTGQPGTPLPPAAQGNSGDVPHTLPEHALGQPPGDVTRFGRGGGPRDGGVPFRGRSTLISLIMVNGAAVGTVVVPPSAPFQFLLRQYAPTLGTVALGALVVGAALATILIFGPPRRRLKALEEAARRFGRGDLTARAPASGGDEVA